MKDFVRIIHTADLHLSSNLSAGSPAVRRAVKAAQESFLANLLAVAKAEQTDILLFAGDVFDSPAPEKFWLNLLQNFCAELSTTRIFFSPGNHDPYIDEGIWTDAGWSDNVHVFTPIAERIELCFAPFNVSIDGQAFSRFLAPEPLYRPEVLRDESEIQRTYRILLLHGDVVSEGISSHYNPILLKDSRYQAYDYIALGHVHKSQSFKEPDSLKQSIYPGIPQGRGFDESGRPGFLQGRLFSQGSGPIQAEWQSRSLAGMLFISLEVDLSNCQSTNNLVDVCWTEMMKFPQLSASEIKTACWRIVLKGARPAELTVALDYLKTQLEHKGAFYVRLYDHSYPALSLSALSEQSGFAGLIYKNYLNELKHQKKADEETQQRLEKALYHALAAHENRASLDQILRGLEAYHEYLAEVEQR